MPADAQAGEVHLEMTDRGARWVPNADVVDPGDEYDDDGIRDDVVDKRLAACPPDCIGHVLGKPEIHLQPVSPTTNHEETPVSHRLNTTISDEAHAALTDAAKDGETENDTVRRLLNKALKISNKK